MNKILSAIRYPLSAISILFVLLSASTSATADTNEIINSEGCKAFFPDDVINPPSWRGSCKDGLAEGNITFGDLKFKGKAQFSSGYANGLMTFITKTGFSFKCNYKDSLRDGDCSQRQGEYLNYTSRYEDGQEMEGRGFKDFLAGAPDGETKLSGDFYQGKLHGFGVAKFIKGRADRYFGRMTNEIGVTSGKYLIAQGIWENGTLVKSCPSKKACQASESRESNQSQQSSYNEVNRRASFKLTDWETGQYSKGRWSVRCDGGNSDGRFLGFVGLDGDGYYHGDTVDKSIENAVRYMIKSCN